MGRQFTVFSSLFIYLLIFFLFGLAVVGCETSDSVVGKITSTYCGVADAEKQKVMRAYYDQVTKPHQIRILCNNQPPPKTQGENTMNKHIQLMKTTFIPLPGSPLLQAVDECVEHVALTGSIVCLETRYENFLFCKKDTAAGIWRTKQRIIDYQTEEKRQLQLESLGQDDLLVPVAAS